MANGTAVLADPRRRNLAILGGLTAFFLILAIIAVVQQSRSLAPKFEQAAFFPGLTDRLSGLGEVDVTSKSGTVHLKLAQGKWAVAERDSFPADLGQIRATAAGMADLMTVEPKTARADWLTYVGLDAPDKGGAAVGVKLVDTTGKAMAELLVGNAQGAADDLGRTTLYVRRPNENQSWLVRGSLTPKPNVADWLDKNVLVIARDRVKGASVTPATGPAYNLARDNKNQPDFKMLDLPPGRALSFEGSPDGVAGAISGFTFDDVGKAAQFDFSKAPQSVFHTFDGLDLTVKIATKDKDNWAIVTAMASNPMVQAEAAAINARLNGWAFKLPEERVMQILATRETLLRPLDSPAPARAPGAPARATGAPAAPPR